MVGIAKPMTGFNFNACNIDIVKQWINDCVQNHARCGDPHANVLPTRVIDVGSDIIEPRIHLTGSEIGQYVALSHCWGSNQANSSRLVTVKSSLKRQQDGIPFGSFPKTFRDAIIFTRLLGLKYLWIDSFLYCAGRS